MGGTWRDNTYPGATCDVPSQLYSYSFAPYDWSQSYSQQQEIQDYIKKIADESGTLDRFVFDSAVEDAAWDDATQRWTVHTPNGTWVSRTLIVGAGGLSAPRLPEIEGIETFQGEIFHSARWNHDVDLDRQAGRGDRDRRLGDPDRPRGAEGRRAPGRLPAHGPVDHPAQRPGLRTARAIGPAPRPRLTAALPHRALLGARGLCAGVHASAEARRARQESGTRQHRQGRSRTRRCARRSPRTSRWAASGSCAPTTTTRRSTPTTPSW